MCIAQRGDTINSIQLVLLNFTVCTRKTSSFQNPHICKGKTPKKYEKPFDGEKKGEKP